VGWLHITSRGKKTCMPTLTKEMIEAAIQGFETQKQHIDSQIAELRAMPSSKTNHRATDSLPTRRKKSGMTSAGRKAIADAQRKRWAAIKDQSMESKAVRKPKRKLSPAGRAAIVAAPKRRWAAKSAAGSGEARQTAKKAARKTAV